MNMIPKGSRVRVTTINGGEMSGTLASDYYETFDVEIGEAIEPIDYRRVTSVVEIGDDDEVPTVALNPVRVRMAELRADLASTARGEGVTIETYHYRGARIVLTIHDNGLWDVAGGLGGSSDEGKVKLVNEWIATTERA